MKTTALRTLIKLLPGILMFCITNASIASDLQEVRQHGTLRHLGIPYANFVTGAGDGFDVELTRLFAAHLGVRYEYVRTDWGTVVQDLVGKKVKASGDSVEILGDAPVKGDMVANGFTVIPWRKKVVNFSNPTFPSQIWLLARADSRIRPIKPTGNLKKDIEKTKALMKGRKVLAKDKTCLDPALYKLDATGADVVIFSGRLNELAPAVIKSDAEMTILDVPDALIALEKWPGKLKIIGPVSEKQEMGAAFPLDAPQLLAAYNDFLALAKKNGAYMKLVKKYYPSAPLFFPGFFKGVK
jgi:ABC-type amino acid transport substrate-binding protein